MQPWSFPKIEAVLARLCGSPLERLYVTTSDALIMQFPCTAHLYTIDSGRYWWASGRSVTVFAAHRSKPRSRFKTKDLASRSF